ncbi:hypothetical protein B0H17DRAFT_1325186 [Mycena rosella]|uniref:SET domain-containing protein n=1 Tax=Mycena rosella TaxID=1033263 RepID=A0AAD7GZ48_MYCRO|nr:hypothetical protein B0H17DRAFT_1325186 [Mycena rosella]
MSKSTQYPTSESIQFLRLPAKQERYAVVIAEPTIAELISAQPNFPLLVKTPDEPTYEIRATPNMGLGMFAKRDLKTDELILSERPVLVYPEGFRSSNPPGGPNDRWKIGDYRAVYLDSSRINHSCSPNTIADFDFPSFSFVVRAVREIKEGEEISTMYCGLAAPKSSRRQLLAFCMDSCSCSVCTNYATAVASDARRLAIASYSEWTVVKYLAAESIDPQKLLEDMLQCMRNHEDEGLETALSYPMFLDISGRLSGMVGDQKLADTQKEKAHMFSQIRASYTRAENFVKWLFEPAESMPERLGWAVSHSKDFEHMWNIGFRTQVGR